MNQFCQWIDAYKKQEWWDKLFNANASAYVAGSAFKSKTEAPKYHDLPVAMQIGIFIQFTFETPKRYNFFPDDFPTTMDELVSMIPEWLSEEDDFSRREKLNDKYSNDFQDSIFDDPF